MKPTGKFPVGVAELEYVARGLVLTPETELKQLDPAKVPQRFLAGSVCLSCIGIDKVGGVQSLCILLLIEQ